MQPGIAAQLDDRRLVMLALEGDASAWSALVVRHQPTLAAIVVRVLEANGCFDPQRLKALVQSIFLDLERVDFAALRGWNRRSSFRAFLAAFGREAAESSLYEVTPVSLALARLPTLPPSFVPGETTEAPESGELARLLVTVGRLSPQHQAALWLRAAGLRAAEIAPVLGLAQPTVLSDLRHIAARFAKAVADGDEIVTAAFAYVLGAADVHDQVRLLLQDEYKDAVRAARERVAVLWRGLRHDGLAPEDLGEEEVADHATAAAFADGTMRGMERSTYEAQVLASRRTLLKTASLWLDVKALTVQRSTKRLPRDIGLAATSLAGGSYRWAQHFLRQAPEGTPLRDGLSALADGLGRLHQQRGTVTRDITVARPMHQLERGASDGVPRAFASLCMGDTLTAATLLAELAEQAPVAKQLYLLTLAAGHSFSEAKALATRTLARAHPDPGLILVCELIRALPAGRPLPWELVRRTLMEMVPAIIAREIRQLAESQAPSAQNHEILRP